MTRVLILAALAMLLLAACAGDDEAGPAAAVEAYFTAAVDGDGDRLRALACAEWEAGAARQAQSFRTVRSTLQDMSCERAEADGDTAVVACEGAIVMDYNGELRDFPLERYRVVREAGEWRYCGEVD